MLGEESTVNGILVVQSTHNDDVDDVWMLMFLVMSLLVLVVMGFLAVPLKVAFVSVVTAVVGSWCRGCQDCRGGHGCGVGSGAASGRFGPL